MTAAPASRNGKPPHRALLAAALCLLMAGCATQVAVRDTSRTFHTVVIDAGHGGHDSGTLSRSGKMEKVAALDVALRLEPKLRAAGFRTVMTRSTDVFIPLNERVRISNAQDNAIFVSIHFNDSRKRNIHGVEAYYNASCAVPIARRIGSDIAALTPNRGAMHANYRVLRLNKNPAVLIECGYLSNGTEASRVMIAAYREQLATRIAGAIVQQRFGEAKKPGNTFTIESGQAH